jgi:tetratricopeptide (TPR) repeat protein
MGIMPAAGHMVHMPAHIWLLTGDYELAATVNERAATVDREYFEASRVMTSGYQMYYMHNLDFIAYARSMEGKKAEGLKATKDLAAALAPLVEIMPAMADGFVAIPIFNQVRLGDWDGILEMPQPKQTLHLTNATWRYARAWAFVARGNRDAAAAEQAAFEAIRKQVPAEVPWGINNKAPDILAVASSVIAARVAATPAEAIPHWQHAVELSDALVYDEPPAWYYPIRESLGAALLRAGRAADAEGVFREGNRRSPRNGRMLFGLLESLRAQHKDEDAAWVQREYKSAWAKADMELRIEEM